MKSYLDLIPISAKVKRKQNRMTILCIVFAVFMVTAIFSMAEMGIRMEQARLIEKHGSLSVSDLMNSTAGQTLLTAAVVLSLPVLAAGVLMIASSMNSSVAQRIEFFGMMRCIGMSKRQITRFVRLEALHWCKTAVPAGLVMGTVTTWGLCAVLRFAVGEEFSNIPVFGVSFLGIALGIFVGVVTVLLAASAPARRAAKVSPVTAVSGNADHEKAKQRTTHIRFQKIETALGFNHAVSARKNLVLMTGSFALSIILFLSFSVMIDFVNCLMPQSSAASDLDIASSDGNTIPPELLETIRSTDGVKEVYGRRSIFNIPVQTGGYHTADLISYDDFDLRALKKDGALKKGSDLSKVYGDSSYVLAVSDQDIKIGDAIKIGNESLKVAGLLKYDPFSENGLANGKLTLITSAKTLERLTGVSDDSLVMVQLSGGATDETVNAIKNAAQGKYDFRDKRDESTAGTYTAFVFCVYAFLLIIALVALLNIVNSISMSVSARTRQYGAMRAVGMDGRQITKMIAAEAFTYAFFGCVIGCVTGLLISRWLYGFLITEHFPYAVWRFPIGSLIIILVFVSLAAFAAVYAPSKRIRSMEITDAIKNL